MAFGWTEADVEKLGSRVRPQVTAPLPRPLKPPKYRNRKTEYLGRLFDSQKEATRYQELLVMEKASLIRDLAPQVSLDCYGANGERVCGYRADFGYWDLEQGRQVYEDVKGGTGTITRLFTLKRKLLRAQGITITLV